MTGTSGGMLIVCQFGFSETTKKMALHTQTSKEWGFTRAYGTQTNGQQEAGLLRQTGMAHHSWPDSTISEQGLASGVEQRASINVPPMSLQIGGLPGDTSSWVTPRWGSWIGSERITWSITTAQIPKDSTDRFPQNASNHNSKHLMQFVFRAFPGNLKQLDEDWTTNI